MSLNAVLDRLWAGLLYRDPVSGQGAGFSLGGPRCAALAPDHSARRSLAAHGSAAILG